MHSSIAIANYFLKIAKDEGAELTHMKVQKLVYIAYGWHFPYFDKPMLSETVEAWRWGPVFPVLYAEFKHYGGQPITKPGMVPMNDAGEEEEVTEEDLQAFLLAVWDNYASYSPLELSALTHQDGTPWQQTIQQNPGHQFMFPSSLVISPELIKTYYQKTYNETPDD